MKPSLAAHRVKSRVAVGILVAGVTGGTLGQACGGSAGASGDGLDGAIPNDATASDEQVLGTQCVNGEPCGDGGTCAGNACCSAAAACGATCCAGGEVCAFQACVTPGATCIDSTQCGAGQYCDYALGGVADAGTADASAYDTGIGDAAAPVVAACTGGPLTGRCMPSPPLCADAGVPEAGPITCLEACEYHPPATTFAPRLEYAWGGEITAPFSSDVIMAPIVLPLEDTNCDGLVNAQDLPDIVFTSFSDGNYDVGSLHATRVVNGALVDRWIAAGTINASTQIAGGDIVGVAEAGTPGNAIVTCGTDGAVDTFHADGTPFWQSAPIACSMPSIADLDGDGKPEVIVEGGILDGATGTLKASFAEDLAGTFVVSDVDGAGRLDVVTSSQIFHADGSLIVDTGVGGSWPAIGDFDKDGKPEVVAVYYGSHAVSVWHYDATQSASFSWVRQGVDMNAMLTPHCGFPSAGYSYGGGPPTVADLNGDGTPDIALAGGIGYVAIDGRKILDPAIAPAATLMWSVPSTDCSSAETGSTVFDFDGTGTAQAIYSDEQYLRVYDGPTGKVLWQTCNTTGTLVEYPLVADVDNDGHADIVVVSNAYASDISSEYQCDDGVNIAQSGVRVFGDLDWVRTRSIWNEHAYHVTNVNDDGTIPTKELRNWTQPGLDDFRQNKQSGGEFTAPDAVVSIAPACTGAYGLVATVTNIGQAPLPAGVVVGFYAGAPPATKVGQLSTLQPLYAAESESLFLPLSTAPGGVVYAVVDDTSVPHPSWHECRTDNDTSARVGSSCGQAQ